MPEAEIRLGITRTTAFQETIGDALGRMLTAISQELESYPPEQQSLAALGLFGVIYPYMPAAERAHGDMGGFSDAIRATLAEAGVELDASKRE